jgi:hypothetical protein
MGRRSGDTKWRAQAESRSPLATRSRLPAQQLPAQPRRRHCEGRPDRAAAGWAVMHSCAEDGMAKREQMKNGNGIFQAPLAASFIAEPIALPTSR